MRSSCNPCSGTGLLLDLDLGLLGWGNIVYIVNRTPADLLIAEASGRGYAGYDYAMLCYAIYVWLKPMQVVQSRTSSGGYCKGAVTVPITTPRACAHP